MGSKCNHGHPSKEEVRHGRGGGDVTTETETGVSSHKPKKAGSHQQLEEARNRAYGGSEALLTP